MNKPSPQTLIKETLLLMLNINKKFWEELTTPARTVN
jgi:hypothetical protein